MAQVDALAEIFAILYMQLAMNVRSHLI